MIKQLRKKLLFLIMLLLSIIFIGFLAVINYLNYTFNINQQIRYFRKISTELGIEAFCKNPPENPRLEDLEYCTVKLSKDTGPEILINQLKETDTEQLLKYADSIQITHSFSGHFHSLVYVRRAYQNSSVVIFLNNDYALENSRNLLIISLIIAFVGLILLFLISTYLTRRLTDPVAASIDSQKQFISDAGHELKTPLTIIDANLDLLEDELGENKHLKYIRSEANHMGTLVSELLTLARLENASIPDYFQSFSLSDALMGIALPFESLAYENQITFDIDIADHLVFYGNQEQLQKLLSILLDNAFQHVSDHGRIQVSVTHHYKKTMISVSNTGDPIPPEMQDKIFQRFYRVNESRETENMNYGLGLSIALSIVKKHHGKINVNCKNGVTTFLVVFSG